MTLDELMVVIKNGENSFVEFKRDDIRPDQLAKELVGFANLKGGTLLLGVEDKGEITGIKRENCEEWVMSVIADIIYPSIFPFYEEITVGELKVAIINIPMGASKPYYIKKHGRHDAYVRLGSQTRLAKPDELRRLFQMSGFFHSEIIPVIHSKIDDWDLRRLVNYFQITRAMEALPSLDDIEEWKKISSSSGVDDRTGK